MKRPSDDSVAILEEEYRRLADRLSGLNQQAVLVGRRAHGAFLEWRRAALLLAGRGER